VPWLIPADQCDALYISLLAAGIVGAPAVLAKGAVVLYRWLRGLKQPRVDRGVQRPVDPELMQRLEQRLMELPRWDDERRRRTFVTKALGKGHPLLADLNLAGAARDVAAELVDRCLSQAGASAAAGSPLCRLLAAIPQEFGAHPERDADLDALRQALGCPSHQTPAHRTQQAR
jgi:cell division septation protein DedD